MIDPIYRHWLEAKAKERAATAERIRVEDAILLQHPCPKEGQERYTDSDGNACVIKQTITRKVDAKAYSTIRDIIPEALRPIEIVEEIKLDMKGYRWLEEHEPALFKRFCTCLIEKAGKPNIHIEEI